jgi:hypothetical protein
MSILNTPKYTKRVLAPGLETTTSKKEFINKMNDTLRRDNLLVNTNEPRADEPRADEPRAKVAFAQSVTDLKDETNVCASGKKAIINPKRLSFKQFMTALSEDNNGKNGLGCGGDTPYVTYEDGKYCCAEKGMTKQQYFDYINILLNGAMANVDDTMFIKNREMIEYLIGERERLIANDSELDDKIILPVNINTSVDYRSIDEWFEAASAQTELLKTSVRPDYDPNQQNFDKDDFEFAQNQKNLYDKRKKTPSYYYPSEAPSRLGLPGKQKSMKQLPMFDDKKGLVENVPLVVAPRRGLVKDTKGTNGLKLGGKTIKRKRNNSKKGGSRKKRTTRNKRK